MEWILRIVILRPELPGVKGSGDEQEYSDSRANKGSGR